MRAKVVTIAVLMTIMNQ